MVNLVHVATPSQGEIKANTREYALLAQFIMHGQERADESALLKLAEKYGNAAVAKSLLAKAKLSDGARKLSFASFVAIFKKEGLAIEGKGNCLGYAAQDKTGVLAPWRFDRREPSEFDVSVQIIYSGMCHSDYHIIHAEWELPAYHFPIVPGHEIIGVVTDVGSKATEYKAGDIVGVGVYIWACQNCDACHKGSQSYCNQVIMTYNTVDRDQRVAQGGYSTHIVTHQDFVFRIPTNLDLSACAPLLCAGITVWSPLMHFNLNKPGLKVGVIGMGGLGHMAIKFLKSFGCKVTVFTRSAEKGKFALKTFGADNYIVSTDPEAMQAAYSTLDGLIDCVSADHDPNPYAQALKMDGKYLLVSLPVGAMAFKAFSICLKRIVFSGTFVGGLKETQEMLDYCGEKNITSDVEVVPAAYTNEAMERMVKGDVRYRFVIDVQGSLVST